MGTRVSRQLTSILFAANGQRRRRIRERSRPFARTRAKHARWSSEKTESAILHARSTAIGWTGVAADAVHRNWGRGRYGRYIVLWQVNISFIACCESLFWLDDFVCIVFHYESHGRKGSQKDDLRFLNKDPVNMNVFFLHQWLANYFYFGRRISIYRQNVLVMDRYVFIGFQR